MFIVSGIDVDEHGPQARERDDVRRRRERVGRARAPRRPAEPEREHREVQRRGAGRDRDRVLDLAGARELGLELGHVRPHREHAALEHLGDRGELLGADVGPR